MGNVQNQTRGGLGFRVWGLGLLRGVFYSKNHGMLECGPRAPCLRNSRSEAGVPTGFIVHSKFQVRGLRSALNPYLSWTHTTTSEYQAYLMMIVLGSSHIPIIPLL